MDVFRGFDRLGLYFQRGREAGLSYGIAAQNLFRVLLWEISQFGFFGWLFFNLVCVGALVLVFWKWDDGKEQSGNSV